jgi:8-oxo-dGTP pyrophosphatase MutT (NUDIX family)
VKALSRLFYTLSRIFWRLTKPITIGVRLILVRDQAVLLVKHTYHQGWYLPGGGVRKGETVEEAARREAAEELGAQLGSLHLFGVYTNFYESKNDHVVVLSCSRFTLTGHTDHEIESFAFFCLDALPGDLPPGSLRRVREYAAGQDAPAIGRW